MVALQGYLPEDDPDRSATVEVLEKNPDIRAMVEKIAGHAASFFGWMILSLDTRQYDDWDPPLRMTITVPYADEETWATHYDEFVTWLTQQDDYDLDRLQVILLSRKMPGAR
jgi:hypothetical protein